ncbi:MAG: ABC transporter ATP-binding protein [bacterium]|nr:ABC transporter ATP-binding protein [bacterium]
MIQLSDITKQFGPPAGGLTAVKDVSFSAKKGDIIGFLGPNGAGKTTTMRMLMGLIKPTSGTITISNLDPIHNRLQLLPSIGYLPENNPLYEDMRVDEYLLFVGEVKGIASDEIDTITQQVDLTDRIHSHISSLSRGYRQRVGLAAALIGDPDILILDEPTSGLDPIEQEKIKLLIKKISKKKIVLFSTHILSEVEDVANRLIIINKGELVYDDKKPKRKGSVEALFKKLVG